MQEKFDTIYKTFRLSGLSVDAKGCDELCDALQDQDDRSVYAATIKHVVETILKMDLSSTFVGCELVRDAISIVKRELCSCRGDIVKIYDAHDIPLYKYDPQTNKFIRTEKLSTTDNDRVDDERPEMFIQRLSIARKRMERHVIWNEHHRGTQPAPSFCLVKVEGIQSSGSINVPSNEKRLIVIGCLLSKGEGKYAIEDETGVLDISGFDSAEFHAGFYSENTIIIVEGVYINDELQVRSVGLPPPEPIDMARRSSGNINFLKQRKFEKSSGDHMIMFFSDVRVDQSEVMAKLDAMLQKCSTDQTTIPAVLILIGDFIDPNLKRSDRLKAFKDATDKLWDVLVKHEKIYRECKIILIPGPNDPGPPANLYPRFPHSTIPSLESHHAIDGCNGSKLILHSNPLWLTFFTRTIVVFRYELTEAMIRNSLHKPKSEKSELYRDVVRTMLSQSHLLPLPQQSQMGLKALIIPSLDHTFRLYPCVPDLVVLADKFSTFVYDPAADEELQERLPIFANPGPFDANKFTFLAYYPFRNESELCQVSVNENEET
ncbi:hypothetical protein ACOME3_002834 [Neoechinorhynchus agilis]